MPFLPSNLVSRQAVAFESTLNANKANDAVAVIFMNAHTPIAEGEVESVSRIGSAEDFARSIDAQRAKIAAFANALGVKPME